MAEAEAGTAETMTLATVGRRMAAFFVDLLLVYAVILVIANVTGKTVGYSPLGFKFGLAGTLLVLLGALIYFVATEAGFGATAGKAAAGIRVLGVDGQRIGFGHSIVRNLLRIVDAIPFVVPFLVGAIFAWNTELSQRLGDKAARTVVVERRGPRTFTPQPR